MRTLDRNKRTFYYCLYNNYEDAKNSDDFETGERIKQYAEPIKCKGNISPASGKASEEAFGVALDYDKTIVLSDDTPISETTMLFVDKEPIYDEGDEPLFDYQVVKVAKSLNYTMIAIKKVAD